MDLGDVAAAVRRWAALLVVAAVVAGAVAAVVTAVRPDEYEAQALVDVRQLLADEDAVSSADRADRTIANELVVAEGSAVLRLASQRPEEAPEELRERLGAEQLVGTDTIAFTARAEEAQAAADLATAYAAAYAAVSVEQQNRALTSEADAVAAQLAVVQDRLAALPEDSTPESEALQEVLQGQLATLADEELGLRGRAAGARDPGTLVLAAEVPPAPVGPGPAVWGLLAAAAALALGVLVVAVLPRS